MSTQPIHPAYERTKPLSEAEWSVARQTASEDLGPILRRFRGYIDGRAYDLEDLQSDVLLGFDRALRQHPGIADFPPAERRRYLARIARRTAITRLRRRQPDVLPFDESTLDGGEASVGTTVAEFEVRDAFDRFFASLSSEDRTILERLRDGATLESIAGEVGLSKTTLVERSRRLRQRLLATLHP